MDIYIVSSMRHLKELLSPESACKDKNQLCVVFVTRDWFIAKEIKNAGLDVVSLDNNLDSCETKEIVARQMKELKTWFIDSAGNDFSIYRGVSLGDSAIHHFYLDVFPNLFCLAPNLIKLIDRYKPEKITYEYHKSYRESIYFDNEDLVIKLICAHHAIDFECIKTDLCDDLDIEKTKQSTSLQRKKRYIINSICVDKQKGYLLDIINKVYSVKHNIKQILNPNKLCIFTDANRGVEDFFNVFNKDYNFIANRKFPNILKNITTSISSIKSCNPKDSKELGSIREKWKQTIHSISTNRFNYFGVDFATYINDEVNWAINNVFPPLIEVINKFFNILSSVKVDGILSQADSTIDSRYIYNIAKLKKIKNFVHPDGVRWNYAIGTRHAHNILLYSESNKKDFITEGVNSNIKVVGNPPFQSLRKSLNNRAGKFVANGEKKKILIGAKNEAPWIVGFSMSSAACFIEEILDGIYPLRSYFDTTIRSNQGQGNCLDLLKRRYFSKHTFDIQSPEELPFTEAAKSADIFIGNASTTILEAAIMKKIVIYYCNDNVYKYPPFDGKSELATATSHGELTTILKNILNGHSQDCLKFNNQNVLERYIGPLDTPVSTDAMRKAIS